VAGHQEIRCKICSQPVDLVLDSGTDDNGEAVHSGCNAPNIKKSSDADAVRLVTEKWQAF
jgi:hypothetical protein